jgi:serine protease Do
VRAHMEQLGAAIVTVRTPIGLGSGFLIHPDGYIVTNDHVIAGEHEISVTFYEESSNAGSSSGLRKVPLDHVRIVATSPDWDLALLKVEGSREAFPGPFPTIPLGHSGELRRGERVFAVGNPLGLERSVSEGIVSLTNRLLGGRLFVQTTAQINPGNSGGPLLNMRGEIVGVNNMKVVAAGAEGLGFAIPVARLKEFLGNLDAFAFDPLHPNSGFRYHAPPTATSQPTTPHE